METTIWFSNNWVILQPLKATSLPSGAKATNKSQLRVVAAIVAKLTAIFWQLSAHFEKSLQSSACRLFSINFPPQMVESNENHRIWQKFAEKNFPWQQQVLNPRPLGLQSSILPLDHQCHYICRRMNSWYILK